MKLLVISHMYPSTFNEVAGIFVHEQVKALVTKGIDVKVVSPVPWTPFPVDHLSRKWKAYSEIPDHTVWKGIKVYYPRYLEFPKALFFASSGRRMHEGIKNLIGKLYREFPFDLIHAHVALPDGYAAALLARRFKKPLIITIHGQDAYLTIHKGRRCKDAVRWAVMQTDRVITVSRPLKDMLEEGMDTALANVRVIHNGVSRSKIYSGEIGQSRPSMVILTLGYLIERKGHRYAIKAIARLAQKYPKIHYKIAGMGPLRKDLEKLSRKLRVEGKVEFLGFVPDDELPHLFASCDIFLLPSWDEAFGVVYLEAMANGKPVIGCKGEGIEDFVEHGKTGLLVKPRNADSLVEALDFLHSHPEEAQAMGERARKLVLENYTWEKNADKTIEVYKEVLNDC